MVNRLQSLKSLGVKVQERRPGEAAVTAKGGLALAQALARRMGLWNRVEREMPGRKDPTQGFTVPAAVCALVHGLLSGGEGFSATEPMRGDAPLLSLLGLNAAPSAETIEEVVKHLASVPGRAGIAGANRVLERQARWLLERSARRELLAACGGEFLPVWADGTLLEVEGKHFDAIHCIKEKAGQLCVACFAGPYLTGLDFAGVGVGEGAVAREQIEAARREVARPLGLEDRVLVLMDSLHGDGPTFDRLEAGTPGEDTPPAWIVGVRKLERADAVMIDQPQMVWRATGKNEARGWEESELAQAWLECEGWAHQRLMVCRRWRVEGELFWRYSAVATSLRETDPRIVRLMKCWDLPFEETIWRLYDGKQAMENQWKELLSDLGLHHPPCARAAVNALFYTLAGLAYNLARGVRWLGFEEPRDRSMRLWRLRREVFDLAACVSRTARSAIARILDARDALVHRLQAAMRRLARC